jgi:hypothetical protein
MLEISMKNINYKNNIIFWIKSNQNIIIKQRFLNRIAALFMASVLTPLSIMSFIVVYTDPPKISLENMSINNFYTFSIVIMAVVIIYIILPILSLVSIFWIPTKAIFKNNLFLYYRYPVLPFICKTITYNDIIKVEFIKVQLIGSFRGIELKDFRWTLVVKLTNKNIIKLFDIKSNYIIDHYVQLKNEIESIINNK